MSCTIIRLISIFTLAEVDVILELICHPIVAMNVMAAPEGEANCVDNHHRLLGHPDRPSRVAAAAPGNN